MGRGPKPAKGKAKSAVPRRWQKIGGGVEGQGAGAGAAPDTGPRTGCGAGPAESDRRSAGASSTLTKS